MSVVSRILFWEFTLYSKHFPPLETNTVLVCMIDPYIFFFHSSITKWSNSSLNALFFRSSVPVWGCDWLGLLLRRQCVSDAVERCTYRIPGVYCLHHLSTLFSADYMLLFFVRTTSSVLKGVQSLWARERGTVVIGYLKKMTEIKLRFWIFCHRQNSANDICNTFSSIHVLIFVFDCLTFSAANFKIFFLGTVFKIRDWAAAHSAAQFILSCSPRSNLERKYFLFLKLFRAFI